MESKWESHYEEWKALLIQAKAQELLNDPLAVWDEAWRHVEMIVASSPEHFTRDEILEKIRGT